LTTIDEAIATKDAELLRKIAHSLKGSSGSIGAGKLSLLSSQLELLESTDFFVDAQSLSRCLQQEFARVAETLKAEREGRVP
jgi:HPt (histidine-containing phosphotransfer) domain-containing protein